MPRTSLHSHAAAVQPAVLSWAITRAKTNQHDLAQSLGTSEAVVSAWIDGSRQPSFRQARASAEHLRVPFGFLFLASPPPEDLPIPDFRRVHGHALETISPDLRDVILATLRRQDWLRDFRQAEGAQPVGVVGSLRGSRSIVAIAGSIRAALSLTHVAERPRNPDEFLRLLVERSESLGISVLRTGIVGLNTHRKLDVGEFRGFSLSDQMAPFVFINGADAKNGQVFTLIHELCHIWLGQSGISGSLHQAQGATETLCNQVAAEVLVPAHEFQSTWDSSLDLAEAVKQQANRFRVSRYVIAIRAFESGLISQPMLDNLLGEYDAFVSRRRRSTGGDFYRTAIARNGRGFTDGVVRALDRNRVLVRDAASLLEVRPSHLRRLTQELRSRE